MGISGFRKRLHEDTVCSHDGVALLLRMPFRNVVTNLLSFLMGHICMFLTCLAAFQMMNVNPCISTVSVSAEGGEEIRSWKAKMSLFFPSSEVQWVQKLREEQSLAFISVSASWGLSAFSGRCSGERCCRFPSSWWKEEKKSLKLMNFAGSGP